ncbi:uncharacterized protein LOC127482068 [Manacus candei]|uniref:uncharacterized protein LOC127482068 n=1 Tax=Manacus candei TaxID=415023 RepID=UPI002226791E|nr:uncharacterized protein LOC127482068 [Manacus candei]XP_051667986.1 uncharacterized protein LOC127482068 [Manacus candei]XP_051667987.1 uncharacterized protein LOC127482068 [Manacus candei]XP_051667988.1 uncharacterized protein LOC127482068 [Manacus candei]XP_051667989.1 uncharacterized protein LOC127482068 [Manacus candei]XP_051667990.1 uncharacterized protein LOC127482068 [Manacus candei]
MAKGGPGLGAVCCSNPEQLRCHHEPRPCLLSRVQPFPAPEVLALPSTPVPVEPLPVVPVAAGAAGTWLLWQLERGCCGTFRRSGVREGSWSGSGRALSEGKLHSVEMGNAEENSTEKPARGRGWRKSEPCSEGGAAHAHLMRAVLVLADKRPQFTHCSVLSIQWLLLMRKLLSALGNVEPSRCTALSDEKPALPVPETRWCSARDEWGPRVDAGGRLPLCPALQRFVPLGILVGAARSRALALLGTTVGSLLSLPWHQSQLLRGCLWLFPLFEQGGLARVQLRSWCISKPPGCCVHCSHQDSLSNADF